MADPTQDRGQMPQGVTLWMAAPDKSFVRANATADGSLVVSTSDAGAATTAPGETVGSTAARSLAAAADATRTSLVLSNQGSITTYYGDSAVVEGSIVQTNGGTALAPGEKVTFDEGEATLAWYTVTTSGSTVLGVKRGKA